MRRQTAPSEVTYREVGRIEVWTEPLDNIDNRMYSFEKETELDEYFSSPLNGLSSADQEERSNMTSEQEIQAMVDRETAAWDRQDAEALVELFHPDMVWPWPPRGDAHDPADWIFPQGRYERGRWKAGWEELFRTHKLVHNVRRTVRIEVSKEGDGAFAVVDVDTLWLRRADGNANHWKGRACKGYTKVGGKWLLIFHTGLLAYSTEGQGRA